MCACTHFPPCIQAKSRPTDHITVFARDFLSHPIAGAHLQDEVRPTWNTFLHHNTEQFQKFLERWKSPPSLMTYWQHMLQWTWDHSLHTDSSVWDMGQVRSFRRHLRHFIVSPADHFPHSLCLHCPQQWHYLLRKTFLDPHVFLVCGQPAAQVLRNIKQSTPPWILEQYRWGLNWDASLSKGYILPKPTRDFAKARPIIDYSTAWPRRLGMALAIAILEIMKVTYADILEFSDVHNVLNNIAKLFQTSSTLEQQYDLEQYFWILQSSSTRPHQFGRRVRYPSLLSSPTCIHGLRSAGSCS